MNEKNGWENLGIDSNGERELKLRMRSPLFGNETLKSDSMSGFQFFNFLIDLPL